MKQWLVCLLLAISPIISSAEENKAIPITASQLFLDDQGMFACVAGQWIPISAVYCSDGEYLAVIRTRWLCPICLFNNSAYADTCQNVNADTGRKCGYPRPSHTT